MAEKIQIEIEALKRLAASVPNDALAQASIAGQINALEWLLEGPIEEPEKGTSIMREKNQFSEKGQWADPDMWGDDGWDHETGAPTIGLMSRAVQVWSLLQQRIDVTVAEAAESFNVTPKTIREAVTDHFWMFLTGPDDDATKQIIEHEGE